MTKRTLFIDADTLLYSSASMQQKNRCLVTHITSGREKLFESKTEFNDWIKCQDKWKKEEFSFQTQSTIEGEPRFAFQTIKQKVDNIVEASGCEDYLVCIQGEGNFRKYYQSEFVQYKAHRPPKPLLYQECFEYTVNKYKGRCVVVDGEETDDFVNYMAWDAYERAYKAKDRDSSKVVIAYVDKDIVANGRGFYLNYNKLEDGIFWNDALSQTNKFWTQVLQGDQADNIPGIEKVADVTKSLYKLKSSGCGPKSAESILSGCQAEKEMAERVIDAYKASWPDNWMKRLQDNCFFLYLRRKGGEMFQLGEYLDEIGVKLK